MTSGKRNIHHQAWITLHGNTSSFKATQIKENYKLAQISDTSVVYALQTVELIATIGISLVKLL